MVKWCSKCDRLLRRVGSLMGGDLHRCPDRNCRRKAGKALQWEHDSP